MSSRSVRTWPITSPASLRTSSSTEPHREPVATIAEISVSLRNGLGLRHGACIGGVRRRVATSLVTIRSATMAAPT
ncbi:hypothetical protein [Salana multivorans]